MSLVETFEGLSTGQKLLAVGGSLAVGLGLMSAFKNHGTTGSGQSTYGSTATGGDGGGLMPPVVEQPFPVNIGGPDPTYQAPGVINTAPVPAPSASVPMSTPASIVPHVSGVADLMSSGVSRSDAETIASRDANIYNLATGAVPTVQQQQVRAAVASSDLHPTAANAANTTANPYGGFGGGNYNTDGPAVAASIAANENRLHSDPNFVNSEITRTNAVIANRTAAGVNTTAQTDYLHELQTIGSGAGTPRSSGTVSNLVSAVDYSNQQKAKLQQQAAAGDTGAAYRLSHGLY